MTTENQPREDFWWAEPSLRQSLKADPAAAIRSLGLNVPASAPTASLIEAAKVISLIWQDGRIITKHDFKFAADDEGLLFGRGVWESTRTIDGRPWLWDFHLERLRNTAQLLNIRLDARQLPSSETVRAYVRELTGMEVVIRLNASAGGCGRPGTVWMTASLPPAPIKAVRLQTCANPVPKNQPYLVWKTFQYATRLRIGASPSKDFDSTLLVDENNNLLEAAHANLFVKTDKGWATPLVDGGLLPGTVRRHLLERSPIPIIERAISKAELPEILEAFVTNSNVGVVPIVRIDDHHFPIGEETRRIANWLLEPPTSSRTTRKTSAEIHQLN